MDLSKLVSMMENNMFLPLTSPGDIEFLIGIMNLNKAVAPNKIPTKILRDYKSEFPKTLSDMINSYFTTVIFPNNLKVRNVIYSHKKRHERDRNNLLSTHISTI